MKPSSPSILAGPSRHFVVLLALRGTRPECRRPWVDHGENEALGQRRLGRL